MEHRGIREGRTLSVLHETVARFLLETADRTPLITVSYTDLNASGRVLTVRCIVFPEEQCEKALSFLRRKERACREYIRKNTSLRTVPVVRFTVAKGVAEY